VNEKLNQPAQPEQIDQPDENAEVKPTHIRWEDMTDEQRRAALTKAEDLHEARGQRRRRGQSW
jgi:hypothetical protein